MFAAMRNELKTPDDVIRAFGGPARMSAWAGVSENAVCWYRHRGIPPALHVRLMAEAARRNWAIDPVALFELDPEDAAVLVSADIGSVWMGGVAAQ
jgi:hypothetical protein